MKREVVHVETQEQYDYVTEKLNYNWNENNWLNERENTGLRIDEKLYSSINYHKKYGDAKVISFEEFKSRYELKIGDTFEKDGFVCEVKEKVSFWVYNTLISTYHKDVELMEHHILITDQEFINQLEKFAK